MLYRGWAKINHGELDEGISALSCWWRATTEYLANGSEAAMSHYISFLARAYASAGKLGEALPLLEGPCVSRKPGRVDFVAELQRHSGELLLAKGEQSAAEALFHKALATASDQKAKMWEIARCSR